MSDANVSLIYGRRITSRLTCSSSLLQQLGMPVWVFFINRAATIFHVRSSTDTTVELSISLLARQRRIIMCLWCRYLSCSDSRSRKVGGSDGGGVAANRAGAQAIQGAASYRSKQLRSSRWWGY